MDDSTEAPTLAHIALQPSLQDTEQAIDGLMALIAFQYRCEELRRRFDEDRTPIRYDDAVDAYRFLARLLAIELGPEQEDPERVDSMGALVSFQDDAYWIQEPVVKAIVEGFEREIAEDSATLSGASSRRAILRMRRRARRRMHAAKTPGALLAESGRRLARSPAPSPSAISTRAVSGT